MQGALCLSNGVLYVARHELTAHVRAYDLDGRPLGQGFSFRGPGREPATASGLDIDADHTLWIADRVSQRVRSFSLFGRESSSFPAPGLARSDAPGSVRDPCDVCVLPGDDEARLLVTCGGTRRHALQVFGADGSWVQSLRPEGDPQGRFHDLRRAAARESLIYACEGGAGRVQVFREGEFHYLFRVPVAPGGRFAPSALAPLSDGRMLVATTGEDSALLLLDRGGRLLRVLAESGAELGQVSEPEDLAVEELGLDHQTRVAVLDRDAERVQVFTIEGHCHGALEALPGSS
jgi:hypothetical protein